MFVSVFLQSYLKQLRRKFRKSSQADEYMDDEGRSIDNVVIKIMNGYGRSINPYHKVYSFLDAISISTFRHVTVSSTF